MLHGPLAALGNAGLPPSGGVLYLRMMEPGVVILVIIVAVLLINVAGDLHNSHRCGARDGLFGKCTTPVGKDGARCGRHPGRRKKTFP